MVPSVRKRKLLPQVSRVLPDLWDAQGKQFKYVSLKPHHGSSHDYEIKKMAAESSNRINLHVRDYQVLDAPVLERAVWHVPPDDDWDLQRTIWWNTEILSRLKKTWSTFLCFSSFWAITRGSVSPSSSTMTGAHMAICKALVPSTRALSYLAEIAISSSPHTRTTLTLSCREMWSSCQTSLQSHLPQLDIYI